ncbi:hypothetical protein GCM10010831_16260 [Psychroflexus salis]|uniref:Uncharacterized protein n=1 Tax=Psychroflexus salis TaxID=1526574 RepID=A0A916ZV73_9FLAO|nr:hypothetical protein GCM10010831_16260 [Psychroflexus salis]
MIEKGASLKYSSFNEIPDYLKELCFDCLEVQIDTPSDQEFELNQELEDLFACDLTFFEFYSQYIQLVSEVNPFQRRPKSYYLSWSRTLEVLNISKSNIQGLLHAAAEKNGVHAGDLNFETKDIYCWFEHNVFKRFPKVMVDFFVQLAQRNLVAIDAIPHVIRNDQSIQYIFTQFEMESFLPDENVDYNLFDQEQPVYELVNDDRFFRQFINLLTFDGQEFELMGLNLLNKPMSALSDMLSDSLYIDNLQLVNLKDSKGNYLLQMIYTNDFQVDPNDQFLFLAPFGQQAYHVVHKSGNVLDTSGYYDFHIAGNIGYMQYSKNLSWIRWSYDEETNAIDKQPVSIENPYKKGIWELTEQGFQQALLENNDGNNLNEFELLKLVFEDNNSHYSIYLTMPNQPTGESIQNEVISTLNKLLNNGLDIADSNTAAKELYKSLLKSNSVIRFKQPNLNIFYLRHNKKVTTGFVKNYQNDDFQNELIDELNEDRPIISHFLVELLQKKGNYTYEHKLYFKMNIRVSLFKKHCEDFVEKNPLSSKSDLAEYAEKFKNFLTGKNYQQANVLTRNLEKHTIANLLDVELNQEGRFDVPQPRVIDSDDDDDLPF